MVRNFSRVFKTAEQETSAAVYVYVSMNAERSLSAIFRRLPFSSVSYLANVSLFVIAF